MKHLHPVGLLLLSCTCLLLCFFAPVRAGIQREAEALVNWKASLGGADESLGPWSMANSTSLCKWTHISCNSIGHIRELDLSGASLNGTLDDFDFSAFPRLKKLIMYQNGLYGTIPAGIGNLTSLVVLRIFSNPYLRGAIPCSIAGLKHLGVLELAHLGLDGTLPEEIGNLTSLEELHLDSITLTGSIPLTIGMLTELRLLRLSNNNLTGSIPLEIGNLTELQGMYFSYNYLEGSLPGTISHLIKLQELYLSFNQLGGHIFAELGNGSLLGTVDVGYNNFSGQFPSSICDGGVLSVVSAEYNGFTSLQHQTFQNCTSLEFVFFMENNIVAELADVFGQHPRLEKMVFSQNQLHGTLLTDQDEVFACNYTSLNLLDLSNNALHGGLSKCFWDMRLGFMDLSSNSLSGVLPLSETCSHTLGFLHLANNHLRGTFPLGLKKCKYLFTLDLGGNHFSGTIPSWVSTSLPVLKFLRLSSNMFDGIIPHQILEFQHLQVLDLSKKKLTGPIPHDFKNFTGMAHEQKNIDIIYYDHYMYAERIEIVWKNVDHVYNKMIAAMVGIDLSGNSHSQEIPNGLTTLLGLRYLNLSGNLLSGCIPEGIGNLVLLESLDFSRNQLSGQIPPSIAALKGMSALNLSSNELSGRIPTGSQLQTLLDPSIYSNNSGLCGFPLIDCVNSSTTQNESQAEDREALWLYCFVAAGFMFGFWLYCGMILFHSEATKMICSCMLFFQATCNV
ncbi:hypothetical protein ACQ4PT_000301 [Festuca glaucescens]